jgi:hypothetical protein
MNLALSLDEYRNKLVQDISEAIIEFFIDTGTFIEDVTIRWEGTYSGAENQVFGKIGIRIPEDLNGRIEIKKD